MIYIHIYIYIYIYADLYVRPTDSYQYFNSSSCHSYHYKKEGLHIEALRFNRICSDLNSFSRRRNDFEKFLIERGYNKWETRKQILRTRGFSRDFSWKRVGFC